MAEIETDKDSQEGIKFETIGPDKDLSLEDISEENFVEGDDVLLPAVIKSCVSHPLQNEFVLRAKVDKRTNHRRSKLKSTSLLILTSGNDINTNEQSESENERNALIEKKSSSSISSNIFQSMLLNNTYRSRAREFSKLCKSSFASDIDESNDFFIADYSCTLSGFSGRLYISRYHIAFYCNLVGIIGRTQVLKHSEIDLISKSNSIIFIPSAITIHSGGEKYLFSSFVSRDKTYELLYAVWQSRRDALLESNLNCFNNNIDGIGDGGNVNNNNLSSNSTRNSSQSINSTEEEKNKDSEMTIGRDLCENNLLPTSKEWQWIKQSYGKNIGYSKKEQEEIDKLVGSSESNNSFIELADIETANESNNEHLAIEQANAEEAERRRLSLNKSSSSPDLPFTESLADDVISDCPCDIHKGQSIVDIIIDGLSINEIFKLNYETSNENAIFAQVHAYRKTTGLNFLSDWSLLDLNAQQEFINYYDNKLQIIQNIGQKFTLSNVKHRLIAYAVAVNIALFKQVPTKETQYLLVYRPDECIVVQSEARSEGVPMSDCFVVNTTYCYTSAGRNKLRLRVHYNLNFVKSVFSLAMFKSQIERNSIQGVTDFINDFIAHLKRLAVSKHSTLHKDISILKNSDSFDQDTFEDDSPEICTEVSPKNSSVRLDSNNEIFSNSSERKMLQIVLLILAITTMINIIVVTKLWRMEQRLALMYELLANDVIHHSIPRHIEH